LERIRAHGKKTQKRREPRPTEKGWPDGTTRFKDVYVPAEEECEVFPREAISGMKKAIAAERERMANESRAS